jgi:hypothetical protein
LDQPEQAAVEGSGGHARLRQSLPLRRFRHATRPAIGPVLMNFSPDSQFDFARFVTL